MAFVPAGAASAVLVTLTVVALVLDAVDGWVARRTGTASAVGARFDMEVDAFLIFVLSVYVAQSVGAWVLAIGAARYAFVAAGWLLPWLREPPPPRYWCKVVAAIQGIVLTVAMADVAAGPGKCRRCSRWLWSCSPSRSGARCGGCGGTAGSTASPGRASSYRARCRGALAQRLGCANEHRRSAATDDDRIDGPSEPASSSAAAPPTSGRLRPGAHGGDLGHHRPRRAARLVRARRPGPARPPEARRVRTHPDRRSRRRRAQRAVFRRGRDGSWPSSSASRSGCSPSLKILDMGFFAALDRPFNPVTDWSYFGPAVGVLRDSVGQTWAVVAVIVAVAPRHRRCSSSCRCRCCA